MNIRLVALPALLVCLSACEEPPCGTIVSQTSPDGVDGFPLYSSTIPTLPGAPPSASPDGSTWTPHPECGCYPMDAWVSYLPAYGECPVIIARCTGDRNDPNYASTCNFNEIQPPYERPTLPASPTASSMSQPSYIWKGIKYLVGVN